MSFNIQEQGLINRLKRGALRDDGVTVSQNATLRNLARRGVIHFDGKRYELRQ